MTTTTYPALRVTMDRYIYIDPNHDFTLTEADRVSMGGEAMMSFIQHVDKFLNHYDLEILPSGHVIGPTGIYFDAAFEEEYREHLAHWDDSALVRKWADIDTSPVTLTIDWGEGTATVTRRRHNEDTLIMHADFDPALSVEDACEEINVTFEALGVRTNVQPNYRDTPNESVTKITVLGLDLL